MAQAMRGEHCWITSMEAVRIASEVIKKEGKMSERVDKSTMGVRRLDILYIPFTSTA